LDKNRHVQQGKLHAHNKQNLSHLSTPLMDVVSGLTRQQKRPVEMSSGVPWSSLPLRKSGKLTKLRLVMIAA